MVFWAKDHFICAMSPTKMQRHIICFMNNMLCSLSLPKRLFWPKQKGGRQVPTKHEQAPIV
jgi:hypothetical protein